jgi:hypothetical protein
LQNVPQSGLKPRIMGPTSPWAHRFPCLHRGAPCIIPSLCLTWLHDHLWWTERKRNIYLSIYPSILFIHPSSHPSIHLSIYPSVYLSIHLSIYLSIHLSISPSVCLSIYPSIYLSAYKKSLHKSSPLTVAVLDDARQDVFDFQAHRLGKECDDGSASGGLWSVEFLVAAGRDVWLVASFHGMTHLHT